MTTRAASEILHSQANCVHPLTIDGDKPKQKRQRKKEHTAQTSLETQLAACKARITMLEETNKDYQNTIQLLTAKLWYTKSDHQDNRTQHSGTPIILLQARYTRIDIHGQNRNTSGRYES
jgi:septal ring factor EnvC (AmiA/AmiB activator)